MKVVRIHAFGDSHVLRVEEAPTPEPAAGELLIRITAAGINPVDAKIRTGKFKRFRPRLPAILGRDIAGTIVAKGPGTRGWTVGAAVFGMLDYERGAYAEYAIASPREIAVRPAGLDPVRAAALPVASLTAWQALFDHGRLKAGQRLLVHGAAGGVGHLAVQFARARGAEVWATARTEDFNFLHDLGVSHAIDYAAGRFEDQVKDMDVVLDLIGGETAERSWSVLRRGGVLVSTREKPKPPARAPARARGREVVVKASAKNLGQIARLVIAGKVRVAVQRVFLLEQARAAHDWLERGGVRGKLVFDAA